MLGLRTVVYRVTDLEKAKDWYSCAFAVKPYFDEPFYVGFNVGGYELGLQPDESTKGDGSVVYWGVADIDKTYNHLLGLGATAHDAPNNVGGEMMVASVIDLWGNIIGIIFNPYFRTES